MWTPLVSPSLVSVSPCLSASPPWGHNLRAHLETPPSHGLASVGVSRSCPGRCGAQGSCCTWEPRGEVAPKPGWVLLRNPWHALKPREAFMQLHQAGPSCEVCLVLCFGNILKTLGYPNNVSKTFLFCAEKVEKLTSEQATWSWGAAPSPGKTMWRTGRVPCPRFLQDPQCPRHPGHAQRPRRLPGPSQAFLTTVDFVPCPHFRHPRNRTWLDPPAKTPPCWGGQAGGGSQGPSGGPRPQGGSKKPEPWGPRGGHRTEAGSRPRSPGLPTSSPERQLPLLLGDWPLSPPHQVYP